MIRVAAAVVLHRGLGADLEVLLVERSPKLRFLGGYHAFPGGVLERDEAPEDAACRELFEETGVLLAGGLADHERRGLRSELLDADRSQEAIEAWHRWRADAVRPSLAPSPLIELGRFLTPPFAPVRYDTCFYLAAMPHDAEVEIVPGELVAGGFIRPDEACRRWRAGELRVAPPVLILLELLAEHGVEAFAAHVGAIQARAEAGDLMPVRFTPGVVMASLATDTLPPATTTNAYLVGGERLHVIDPAPVDRAEQRRLIELIERRTAGGARLESVLLTHHHPDHVGAAAVVARRFGVPIRAHRFTLERVREPGLATAELTDGDRVDLGVAPDGRAGWTLRALFTPGHARGHLCFHEDRYGSLFAGDMASTISTIVIDPPEGHLRTYLDSLERLLREPIATLYPAHGPPAPFGRKVIEHYVAHRAEREAKLVAVLRASGSMGAAAADEATEADLLPRVYDDVDAAMFPVAARSLRAGLEKLAEEGRVAAGRVGWRLVTE